MSYINYVAAAATAALLVPVAGAAQDKYPVDTVTMVVPYSAGGTADTVGRLVAVAGVQEQII